MTFVFAILFFSTLAHAEKLQELTVILDWYPNPDHAPLFVAQDQNYFQQQGLNVKLIGPSDPADPPKFVAAEKVDIAVTYQPQFLLQVDQGLPLIQIGTLIDSPLNALVVLKEGPIKKIADLKGKRVGYSTSSIDSLMLEIMLKHNGLRLEDVERIHVHYDLTKGLLSKKIDAVTGMMRNVEVTQLAMMGHPARVFYPEKNGLPSYSELIFVANQKSAHDPRLRKFLLAVKQGATYLREHPEESWQAFAAEHPEANDAINHQIWFNTLPLFSKNPENVNTQQLISLAKFLQKNKLIREVQPVVNYVK